MVMFGHCVLLPHRYISVLSNMLNSSVKIQSCAMKMLMCKITHGDSLRCE